MAAIISSTEAALLADSNKTIKLRSSCDTCNEAKVRCSQSKPHCQRCLRLGTTCVYGLSRRSHKTAPRIGASQTSALAYLYTNSQSTNSDGSDDIDQFRDDLQWLTGQSTPDMNIDAWSYALGKTIYACKTCTCAFISDHSHRFSLKFQRCSLLSE
jgi:hypothetical protein